MPERETTNVVRFEPLGRSVPDDSPHNGRELLAGCRDRLAHGAATAFAEHLNDAADNLLAFAERAISTEAQHRFFAAHGILAKRGQELLQRFRVEFISACDAALLALDRPRIQPATEDASELCLVADDDFERELTIGKLSARADYNCSQQLTALERRVAALRQGRRVTQIDNPLWPKAIFTAFLAACQDHGASDQVDLTLLQEFAHQITNALPNIYQEINRYLAEHNVLPNMPLGASRPVDMGVPLPADRAKPACIPQLSPAPESTAPRPGSTATFPGSGFAVPGDVFTQLADRLLESQALSLRPAPRAPKPTSDPTYSPAQVIEALTQLQKGATDAQCLPGIDPQQLDPSAGNLLRRIRSTPLIAWSQPVDAITVDVVAMLFDLILNDRELPGALRAQIGRLQIPVLKVAMLDKGFFSNRQHPARRLLDGIAGAATGWEEQELPRLTEKLRTIVEAVLDGFDEDVAIFSTQLAVLEAFLADEEKRGAEAASKLQEEVEQEDSNALARQAVAEQVQRHTANQQLPDLIRDFLERLWQQVLVEVYQHAGASSQGWKEAIATMDALVWSVTPKTAEEERRRLLDTLPGLLHRLRSGLTSVDLADEWDGFFTRLVRMHVEAIHPDQARTEGPAKAGTRGPPPAPLQLRNPPAVAASTQAQDVVRPPSEPTASGEEPYLELARGLSVGCWIEFRSSRGNKRAMRLNWCSEQRGAYLFSNLQGDDTLIVATTSLAEQLRDGSARILSRDSLTERAVDRLLTRVSGSAVPNRGA
jgi:hypothetical protein